MKRLSSVLFSAFIIIIHGTVSAEELSQQPASVNKSSETQFSDAQSTKAYVVHDTNSSVPVSESTQSNISSDIASERTGYERTGYESTRSESTGSQDTGVNVTSQTSIEQAPSKYVQRLVGDQGEANQSHSPSSTTQLAVTVAGLFAVIGMIFVIAWGVRRLSGGQFGSSNAVIKILATQPLGTKERICLIDVGGQQVLVGITAQSMQTLMVLDQPIDLKSAKQSQAWSSAESVNSVFGAKLQTLLKGTQPNEGKKSSVDD